MIVQNFASVAAPERILTLCLDLLKAKLKFTSILYGPALVAAGFGNPTKDARTPDIILICPAGGGRMIRSSSSFFDHTFDAFS